MGERPEPGTSLSLVMSRWNKESLVLTEKEGFLIPRPEALTELVAS